MLNLTESNTFQEFTWDHTHQTFIDFLTTERPEVLWLIRLQRKNQQQRLQTSIHTEELWMVENTERLTIELDDTVRFSSECLIVRNVFLNWSARNPEVQFCFPICSKAAWEGTYYFRRLENCERNQWTTCPEHPGVWRERLPSGWSTWTALPFGRLPEPPEPDTSDCGRIVEDNVYSYCG